MKERITKLTNLDINDSLSSFEGHSAQQFHGAYEVFYNFISDVKPKRILEIGTALGGFTTFLKICCNELNLDTNIRSYDVNSNPWYKDIIARGVDIRVENIFSENAKLQETYQDLWNFIGKVRLPQPYCPVNYLKKF
jgi:hypothetical protein